MRASFVIMGPLLARYGKAKISMPGGCAIGTRPIDLHLKGFEALGAEIEIGHGFINATAPNGLKGTSIYLDFPSVGATENIMMGCLYGRRPNYFGKCCSRTRNYRFRLIFLNIMGAKIRGAGTNVIKITGVPKLIGHNYTIIPDRIEAGTYMVSCSYDWWRYLYRKRYQ